jgi:hypothetical protein
MFQFKNQQFVPAGLGILPLIVALAGMVAEAGQSQPKVPVYVRNGVAPKEGGFIVSLET